ncbi:hypothetical protein GGI04_003829 [Coemansia thaxteri]|nr:hypothetical protein GGI04_003829 [Coemansia thaxteri]
MGLFSFSLFKRSENYEQILSNLEQDIRRSEKSRLSAVERITWWAHNWIFYLSIVWLAYLAGFVLYVWPGRYGSHANDFMAHLASILVIPVCIYYGAAGIRSVGQSIVVRHDRRILALRAELKERLDELKKKTAFDSTKSLIDRFSTGGAASTNANTNANTNAPPPLPQNQAARLRQQQQQQLMQNRRRTMPNFASVSSSSAAPATGSAPTSPQPIQHRQQQQKFLSDDDAHPRPPNFALPETGVVKLPPRGAAAAAAPAAAVVPAAAADAAASRPWLDKLVDQLVGSVPAADEKYALVCRHCYAHNGLVLEDEINDIQYTCPKCAKFNPSIRSLREASAKPTTTTSSSHHHHSAVPSDDDTDSANSAPGSDIDDSNVSTAASRSARVRAPADRRSIAAQSATREPVEAQPLLHDEGSALPPTPPVAPEKPVLPKAKPSPKKRKNPKSKRA